MDERDDDFVRVRLADWNALEAHVRRFAEGGEFEVTPDRAAVEFGSARFAVTRDGEVEAGMPLHGFEGEEIDALAFDHEGGAILVERADGGDFAYRFRRPR